MGLRRRRRILVVANETVAVGPLREAIRSRARQYVDEVFIVCPALGSLVAHGLSDADYARAQAHRRLDTSLAALAALGIQADGCVSDADPLQAIEHTLRTFRADELIISTYPRRRSTWLEHHIVYRARERFGLPIAHVIVDPRLERGLLVAPAATESRTPPSP